VKPPARPAGHAQQPLAAMRPVASPAPTPAPAPAEVRRKCAQCDFTGAKNEYSSSQWSKGTRCKCRACAAKPPARPAGGATGHLRDRQAERKIGDVELAEAKEHGDKKVFKEDGTIHYIYKNIEYVVSASDGAGITAWRQHPAQCICKHKAEDLRQVQQEESWQQYDHGFTAGNSGEMRLSVGMMKAAVKQITHGRRGPQRGSVYDCADFLCCELSTSGLSPFLSSGTFRARSVTNPLYAAISSGPQQVGEPRDGEN
jgi:hypothetical protein